MGIDFVPALNADGTLAAFESKTLEYKRDLSSPDRVMRALVAFANSSGGCVVVGVGDDHSVVGVEDPLAEENRLANLVMDAIRPLLVPEIETVPVGDKLVLVAKVYPAGRRPFHVAADGASRGVYVRLGSSNVQADRATIAELERQSEGGGFDQLPNHGDRLGLDTTAIAKTFPDRDVASAQTVLQLTVEDQGTTVPTNGGVLLFGKERERLFPDAWVYCGRFRGPDGLDLVDMQELYAPLLDLPDLVEAFLKKHAFRGADLTEWRRQDDWSVPLDIIREAVVNALVHSDYAQSGGPLRVAFYDDRVYVESLGGLLPGMTIEAMRSGVSRVRNRVIARVFREAGMIEQWGYGVQRMFRRAAELGLPEPSYVELPGRLRCVIPTMHAQIMAGGAPTAESPR
ncbi:MAG: putative DNA binding domain-containing protein, partial [Propionibacteriaceae bacterium]|nr:putative DNA binding domain-containing protein [Propionibacteriaceae bacterium]